MSSSNSSTGPIRTELSRHRRHRIASYFRSKGIRWDGSHEIPLEFSENLSFRSKSEEIDDEDVQYYCTERCAEAGEEYDPKLKWLELESESEVDNDQSSGCGAGVFEDSSGKYFAPTSISKGWPICQGAVFMTAKFEVFFDFVFENTHSFYFSP